MTLISEKAGRAALFLDVFDGGKECASVCTGRSMCKKGNKGKFRLGQRINEGAEEIAMES